ncbi:MAG: preprotein translocase subunit SecA [Candidatus Woesebacteria bacterium]|nr:MAG: preprotein translocase subunit SecA [Candidatus Woesebacteria bacterium]
MIKNFLKGIIDINQKEVAHLQKVVDKVNLHEAKYKKFKLTDFPKETKKFQKRIEEGEILESILPEAFALVREASDRAIGLRHYDVQLMAAVALFEGKVAEQKTGEGKTLSAVPALYLRAITGKGVHLVTVNDYLARRDAGWNAPIFHLLGLTVGSIIQENKSFVYDPNFTDNSHGDERLSHLKPTERKKAYEADITYGTNNEFGFDYLRDNMVGSLTEMAQRGHYFAIVDEVDSVLIDEARTPLIISAPDMEPTDKYYKFASIIDKLVPDTDYEIDEKMKSATLTEDGIAKIEKILKVDNLYEKDFDAIHHIENALRARSLYLLDRDYVVKDGQVIIVDEFTGRLMFGRRWSDGLHQAVEAKEGVTIQQESKTLATISFQNYFRMYEVLSGMTGTALTEADEFKKIYEIEVVAIPTNMPMVRKDKSDAIYKTIKAKYEAVANRIADLHKKGQPVLVGTTSIEKNEIISEFLKSKKIPHNVLNAKNHEKEAMILAEAGKPGGVTVATNMAGRGVDIILGGASPSKKSKQYKTWEKNHEKVVKAGGLFVLGTERHESRRIDNQLRGRSGRQGDPGTTQFFLSLEDDLMRVFGGTQIASIMDRLRLPDNEPIENRLVSRAIESAQIKVEGFHFDARKRVVEYDDVANQQRDIVYKLRRRILESNNVKDEVLEKLDNQVDRILLKYAPLENQRKGFKKEVKDLQISKENAETIAVSLADTIPFDDASVKAIAKQLEKFKSHSKLQEFLKKLILDTHQSRESQLKPEGMRLVEKYAYLNSIDHLWIDHLDQIDDLREGINLRAYGQRDPLVEFKNEAYDLFETLIDKIDEELAHRIFRMNIMPNPQTEIPVNLAQTNEDLSDNIGLADSPQRKKIIKRTGSKMGRNDPCWCGSGKKWKKCHYPQLPS